MLLKKFVVASEKSYIRFSNSFLEASGKKVQIVLKKHLKDIFMKFPLKLMEKLSRILLKNAQIFQKKSLKSFLDVFEYFPEYSEEISRKHKKEHPDAFWTAL